MVWFTIDFDKSDRKYRPGEIIHCTIRYSVTSPLKCRSIYARFRGHARVRWIQTQDVYRNRHPTVQDIPHNAEEEYFKHYSTLLGVNGGKYQRHYFLKVFCR